MFASDRATWQNPRVLSTLSLVFLAGALAGALFMQSCLHDKMHRPPLSYDRLKTELKLSSVQAEQIKTILDDFVGFNKELQSQIEDTRATGKNNIMSVLDADQKKKFERICSEVQMR